MRQIGSNQNGDYDLSSQVNVFDANPVDASNARKVQAVIEIGDGTKDLDASGGEFSLYLRINGQPVNPYPQTVTFAAQARAVQTTVEVIVPANQRLEIDLLSPNAADTDVDVTVGLYDTGPLQPTTASRQANFASDGVVKSNLSQIKDDELLELGGTDYASTFFLLFGQADGGGHVEPANIIRDAILSDSTAFAGADVALIKGDTNELQGDWTDGGRLDTILDLIKGDTNEIKEDTNELQGDWTDGGRLDTLLDRLITELDTARGEPGQGVPPVSTKIADKIDYIYKRFRNKSDYDGTTEQMYADDGSTVDHKRTVSESGGTVTSAEVESGP